MSDNELTRIPPGIGNFSYLVELDISRNGMPRFLYLTNCARYQRASDQFTTL